MKMSPSSLLEWHLNNIHLLFLVSIGIGVFLGFCYWLSIRISMFLYLRRKKEQHDWIMKRMKED